MLDWGGGHPVSWDTLRGEALAGVFESIRSPEKGLARAGRSLPQPRARCPSVESPLPQRQDPQAAAGPGRSRGRPRTREGLHSHPSVPPLLLHLSSSILSFSIPLLLHLPSFSVPSPLPGTTKTRKGCWTLARSDTACDGSEAGNSKNSFPPPGPATVVPRGAGSRPCPCPAMCSDPTPPSPAALSFHGRRPSGLGLATSVLGGSAASSAPEVTPWAPDPRAHSLCPAFPAGVQRQASGARVTGARALR